VIQSGALLLVVAVVMCVLVGQFASEPGDNSRPATSGPGPVVVASNVSVETVTLNGRALPGPRDAQRGCTVFVAQHRVYGFRSS
jgi:hypothetical protein